MGRFVGVSVVLFMLAVLFVALAQGPEMAALIAAFRSEPLLHKVAWGIVVLVPLLMLPFAVWLWDQLLRQRQAATALELRLAGVRSRVTELTKAQTDVDADLQQLTRSDPEDAIAALQRRIAESERFAQIQQSRNEMVDLDARVGALRTQQQNLKERLSPVLDVRHSIEQVFAELDGRQRDIERSLAAIASGDDGTALDLRLKNLVEFVRQSNASCDQIEQASKTVATLNEACAELRTRLLPFAEAEDGITGRIRRLGEERDRLTAEIEALERAPDGSLAERVEKLSADKKKLDDGIAHLHAQFSQLAALRRDVGTLFAAFDRALNTIAVGKGEQGAAGIDARVDALSHFVEQTQTKFEEIEQRVAAFEQLQARLRDLQARLAPLESDESGVVRLIEDLHDTREKLIAKIRRIEGGEEGDLAARVKALAETKRELEDRVASLADQFTKLSTIRKDIAGLFDKLSSAVSASAD
jgi:chromosome segregation ATPase